MLIKYFRVTVPGHFQNNYFDKFEFKFKSIEQFIKFYARRLNQNLKLIKSRKIEDANGKMIGQNWKFSFFKNNIIEVKIPESLTGIVSDFPNIEEAFSAFIDEEQFNLDVSGISLETSSGEISLYGFKIENLTNFDLLLIKYLEKKSNV